MTDIYNVTEHRVWIDRANEPVFARHNFPCPRCWYGKAIYNCNKMAFEPCDQCSRNGWRLVNLYDFPGWLRWLVRRALRRTDGR